MKATSCICILALMIAIFSFNCNGSDVTQLESGCARCQQIINLKNAVPIFYARITAICNDVSNPKELEESLKLFKQLLCLMRQAENCIDESLEALKYIYIKSQTILETMQSVTANKIVISSIVYKKLENSLQTAVQTTSDVILKNKIDIGKLKRDFESDGITEFLDVARIDLKEKSETAFNAFNKLIANIDSVINAILKRGPFGYKNSLESIAASGLVYVGISDILIASVDQNIWPKAVPLLNTINDIMNKVYSTFGKKNYEKSAIPVFQKLVGSTSQIVYTMKFQLLYGTKTTARVDDFWLKFNNILADVNDLADNAKQISSTAGQKILAKLQVDLVLLDDKSYLANTVDLLRKQNKTLDTNVLLSITGNTRNFICIIGNQSNECK